MKFRYCIPAAALAWSTAGCGRPAAPAAPPVNQADAVVTQVFEGRGIVREVKPEERSVVIRHEAISNYMAAMTMPFEVKDRGELAGLQPGDPVKFRLLVTPSEGWIDRIERLGGPVTNAPAREFVRQVRLVEPLKIGDELPEYRLTNEVGRVISLSQFRGGALGITFIFTRCPYPNFCPRMSERFAEAARRLSRMPGGPTNWHLLSVSFDPEHDTPEVLREYAGRYAYDPRHWSFATGSMIDLDALTEQFGLFVARDGDSFTHNVRTAVIDAEGRVAKILTGNEWAADELVDAMVRAARVAD